MAVQFSLIPLLYMIINYLTLSLLLFTFSLLGVILNRKNLIIMIMSIELLLLSVNCNFLSFSVLLDDIVGQIFCLFILTVAAAESAIGLSILIAYYRLKGNINIMFINLLKG